LKEQKKEIAKKLLKIGIAIDQISQVTGFTFEDIEKLKE